MNTNTIARNSFWYGTETAVELAAALVTSVAVARVMGPEKLGHFVYLAWLVSMTGLVAGLGLPAVTRKYMAEYFGRGEPGVARAIFSSTLRLQALVALAITATAMVLVFTLGDPALRLVSALLAASILPMMVVHIPSQANMAAENLAANVPGSLVSAGVYVAFVILTLTLDWGLVGLAAGVLTMRTAELVVRLVPALLRMRRLPLAPLPESLGRRMFVFSRQSTVLLLLNLVVWERSEFLFLKNFCGDIREVAFYSLASNISEKLLMVPRVFGQAAGATLMAQYGRDETRLRPMVSAAARYLGLGVLPTHLGLAVLSGPVMILLYGSQYLPAIPVLTVAVLLAIPKAFLLPAQHLLQATEQQKFLVRWGLFTAALNLALDWLLIPRYGAMGAAVANGAAQSFAVLGLWVKSTRLIHLDFPRRFWTRLAISAVVMAVAVHWLTRGLPAGLAAPAGIACGLAVFALMLRLTGSLEGSDRERFLLLRRQVPAPLQACFDWGLGLLIPAVESKSPRG